MATVKSEDRRRFYDPLGVFKKVPMQQKQQNLPIGYWIKKADELLTKSIDQIHQNANLTRVGWQLLHSIQERKIIQVS